MEKKVKSKVQKVSKKALAIVIPIYKETPKLKFLFESIVDQNFQDFSVYIIFNGGITESPTVDQYKDVLDIHIKTIDQGHASVARNVGIKMSKEALILCTDQDIVWMPGALMKMVERLQNNKDVGLVYCNYKFEDDSGFLARSWDITALSTMNFISTMSMFKREYVKEYFPEEMDFFQDWYFMYKLSLSLSNSNKQGLWINDFLFSTEIPNADSISGNLTLTLAEKAQVFRKNVGIPDRTLVVTTTGSPFQAERRAKMLNADYCGPTTGSRYVWYPIQLRFINWEATYLVGCFNSTPKAFMTHLDICYGHKIIHFVGTDVHNLLDNHSVNILRKIISRLQESDCTILVNSRRLQNELESIGLKSEVVYTPIYQDQLFQEGADFPDDFTVGVYYSDSPNLNYFNDQNPYDNNNGKSNLYLVLEVAKAMPHIKFKFFGGRATNHTDGNIEFCGSIKDTDMPAFINSCSAILRSTIHDSMPQLVIQFMLMGRDAITNSIEIPNVIPLSFEEITDYTDSKNEIMDQIQFLFKRNKQKVRTEKGDFINWYHKNFQVGDYVKKIYSFIKGETKNG